MTLPIPIVVNSFASYYKNRLWRNEVAYKKRTRARKRKEMEMLMRDNLLNILTVPGIFGVPNADGSGLSISITCIVPSVFKYHMHFSLTVFMNEAHCNILSKMLCTPLDNIALLLKIQPSHPSQCLLNHFCLSASLMFHTNIRYT